MRVCGGDAITEHVVGVGLGCVVGAVGVGVRGEEVADGGVVVGCNGQDVRCPSWSRRDGGSPSQSKAGEGIVGVEGGFAFCFRGEENTVERTPDNGGAGGRGDCFGFDAGVRGNDPTI